MKEDNQPAFRSSVGNGCGECKKALLMLKVKRQDFDVLEGMACVGGCANGPGTIETNGKVKQRFDKENAGNTHKISDTLKAFEHELEHIHVHTHH
jgi:ferredoxin hydrogenase large subunit